MRPPPSCSIIGNHMVTYNDQRLDLVFGALADPIRRELLHELSQGDRSVSELARPFPVSRPAISKHLNVLQHAGLIRRTKQGRMQRCGFKASPLASAAGWLDQYRQFWEGQLDRFQEYVENLDDEGGHE